MGIFSSVLALGTRVKLEEGRSSLLAGLVSSSAAAAPLSLLCGLAGVPGWGYAGTSKVLPLPGV